MRAFVKLRQLILSNTELKRKIGYTFPKNTSFNCAGFWFTSSTTRISLRVGSVYLQRFSSNRRISEIQRMITHRLGDDGREAEVNSFQEFSN